MESYIQISKINDFTYCPMSLYLHSVYESFDVDAYHQSPQVKGRINHENIEAGEYSTEKKYLQGTMVYSEVFGILGKIDIYDQELKTLIERKSKLKKIFPGHRYQLYAQYFCLMEMGHEVRKMFIHDLARNVRHEVQVPGEKEKSEFERVLYEMRHFNGVDYMTHRCSKCKESIYGVLTW